MKYIFSLFVLFLINCKGQDVDLLSELKNLEPKTIVINVQKKDSDSISVTVNYPKSYLINSTKELRLVNVEYHKDLNNSDKDFVFVDRKNYNNLEDTITVNLKFLTYLKLSDFKDLTNINNFQLKTNYKITDNKKITILLDKFKNDEILFKYRYVDNPKEIQVLSTSLNLE